MGSWNISQGLLKIFPWSKDFLSSIQQNNTAQVWVHFYGLAQEYWKPKILFAITRSIGTPIFPNFSFTKPMIDKTFGHFFRVLVDMDVSSEIRYKILVERQGFAFFTELEYKNTPFLHGLQKN